MLSLYLRFLRSLANSSIFFVLIFTVLKMNGEFSRAALEQDTRRTNASQRNGLTVWYVLAHFLLLACFVCYLKHS